MCGLIIPRAAVFVDMNGDFFLCNLCSKHTKPELLKLLYANNTTGIIVPTVNFYVCFLTWLLRSQ